MDKIGNTDKLFHLKFGQVMQCLCEAQLLIVKLKPLGDKTDEFLDQLEENIRKVERDFTKLFDKLILKKNEKI